MADPPDFPAGPLKLMILPRTLDGLGRAGLRRHLETVHGPLVMAETEASEAFRRYVHHYAIEIDGLPLAVLPDRDALTTICFDRFADLIASKSSAAYVERIAPDEDNFRQIDGSIALSARETVILRDAHDAARKLFVFRKLPLPVPDHASLAAIDGLASLVRNDVSSLEGEFPFVQIDEIGLDEGGNPALVTSAVEQALGAGADEAACVLATEAVYFIPRKGLG